MYRILKDRDAQQDQNAFEVFQEFRYEEPKPNPSEPEEEVERPKTREEIALEEAIYKAEQLLETAREQSEIIIEEARNKGYEDGFREGEKQGFQQAYNEQQEELQHEINLQKQQIADYVADMQIEKEKILEQYLDDLKNISLAIGEKIVQASLKSSSQVVKRMILAATEKLKKTAWAKIYIAKSNEDMEIQGDAQMLKGLSRLSDNVKIIVMEDAEPGTCIVELPQEIIDISTSAQLENIREILNNARL